MGSPNQVAGTSSPDALLAVTWRRRRMDSSARIEPAPSSRSVRSCQASARPARVPASRSWAVRWHPGIRAVRRRAGV